MGTSRFGRSTTRGCRVAAGGTRENSRDEFGGVRSRLSPCMVTFRVFTAIQTRLARISAVQGPPIPPLHSISLLSIASALFPSPWGCTPFALFPPTASSNLLDFPLSRRAGSQGQECALSYPEPEQGVRTNSVVCSHLRKNGGRGSVSSFNQTDRCGRATRKPAPPRDRNPTRATSDKLRPRRLRQTPARRPGGPSAMKSRSLEQDSFP